MFLKKKAKEMNASYLIITCTSEFLNLFSTVDANILGVI